MKQFVRDIFRKIGLEVGSYRSRRSLEGFLEMLFEAYEINVTIDVGANIGQYAKKLRRLGFKHRVVSFEPIPNTFSQLFENLRGDPNWIGYNKALGREVGKVEMVYEPEQTDMASLYNPSASVPDIFAKWKQAEKHHVTVQMDTLDNVFSECIVGITGPNIFLKCDTQGHDLEVLKGGHRSLETIRAIQIEIPIIHLYERTTSFGRIIDSLKEMGFEPCAFYPVTITGRNDISVVEFDCIAVRSTQS